MTIESASFSPRLLQVQGTPPHPLAGVMVYLLLAFFGGVLGWAAWGNLDIVAVAEGKLVPASYVKIVQPAEAGVVKEILVREGERVAAGRVLIRMDPAFNEADRQALLAEYHAKRLAVRRIDAQLEGRPILRDSDDPAALFGQVAAEYAAHVNAYESALAQERGAVQRARHDLAAAQEIMAKLVKTLPLYAEQARAFDQLARDGYMGRLMATEKQREHIEKEQELRAQAAVIEAARATIAQSEQRLRQITADYRRQLQTERVEMTTRVEKITQDLAKQMRRHELLELKAPQDAVVKELATHTAGTVTAPGTVLATLVPADDALKAEVWVRNDDVGFIRTDQPVRLKLATFPFQKYGTAAGRLADISADATDGATAAGKTSPGMGLLHYRALVSLDMPYLEGNGGRHRLHAGMKVTAEIHIGTRTVLEYAISPVTRAFHEAARER